MDELFAPWPVIRSVTEGVIGGLWRGYRFVKQAWFRYHAS